MMPNEWRKSWVVPVFKRKGDVLVWELPRNKVYEPYHEVEGVIEARPKSRTCVHKSVWVHAWYVHSGTDI